MQSLFPADDQQLIKNGYEPIPCSGKAAVSYGWQQGTITSERIIALRKAYPEAENTGLRTGKLVAIDIDIVGREITQAIIALAEKILGPTPLHRFGSKGMLLCYQTDEPFRKVTVLTDTDDKIEILSQGLQFVAFGTHPTTEKLYAWTKQTDFEENANPLTVPLDTLPTIQSGQLNSFLEQCITTLGNTHSNCRVKQAGEHENIEKVEGVKEDTEANIARAIEHLKNCVGRGEVATIGQLGNDTIYEMACCLRDRFCLSHSILEDLMLVYWYPHCIPNTLEDECRAIISHAVSYMQNEPGARAAPPIGDAFREALDKLPVHESSSEGPTAKHIILQDENFDLTDSPVRADFYIGKEFPKLKELIPIWLERNINTFLEGPAATQKSRSALQDAIALSAGLPVLGQERTEPCECIYLNYENSPDEMARRIHLICKSLQASNKDAAVNPKGVHIWELRKNPRPILVCGREGVIITRFGQRMLSLIATRQNMGRHTLLVFDGLMDAIIFKDNTRNDDTIAMGLIRLIDSWCMEYDFTALSIVHPSRSSERGGSIGSYATAWSTKPRAIQTFKRVLSPFAGGGPKAKITEDTPLDHIFYQRRVQKRSNGPEGERMLLEYWKGGLRPHKPAPKGKVLTTAPESLDEPELEEAEF